MQFTKRAARGISIGLLAMYGNAISLPAQAAVRQEVFGRFKPGTEGSTPKSTLEQMRELTRMMKMGETSLAAAPSKGAVNGTLNALKSLVGNDPTSKRIALEKQTATSIIGLQAALAQQSAEQLKELSANSAHIKAKNLPAVIQQRQADAIALLQSRQQQLQSSLDQLAKAQTNNDDSKRQQALTTLSTQLEDWGGAKQAKTDFKHLPWGSPSSTVRAPISAANIKAMSLQRFNLKQGQYTFNPSLLAKNNQNLDPSKMTPQQLWDNATPTVFNSKTSIGQWQQIAYSGMTTSNQNQWPVLASLPATVQAADTAANDDAQITPAIQTLATSLHKNPAEIYKWVYDNIEYIPTYGSIQGSDMTLQTKRGNAFDTSSLLISLLRASGIPARYVYGSIDVNPTILKDWVGGVNNTDAAQNLMGQGGIPNVALTSGSQVTAVRMEHVWVEANLNFNPARGGVQKGATNPNTSTTWIPLDASYKTHTRTAGINLAEAVPFDAQALLTSAQQGAMIDSTNGWVQNLNQANVNSALTNYQAQVKAYIDQTKPNATVGDVLGTTQINAYKSHMLSPTLPYVVNAVVSDYSTLPNTMKSFFIANIYADSTEQAMGDTPSFSVKVSTSSLQGKPLALSFNPTSASDESALESFLPKPHADGSPIQPSELPTRLPGYLIHMTPSITLDGMTLQTGGNYPMGQPVTMYYGFQSPNGQLPLVEKVVRAGEYHAIGYNLQGMSGQQLTHTQEKLIQSKSIIENQNQQELMSLTKDDVMGAVLQSGVQSYFSINQNQDATASHENNIVVNPYLSIGTFSTSLVPNMAYGVPIFVKIAGVTMDIDRLLSQIIEKNNDKSNEIAFGLIQGPRHSANEHIVPEALFNGSNLGQNVQSISAMKALQIASSQGQKIFVINQANLSISLPQLNQSPEIIQDVKDAVEAGKVVTISQSNVSISGWSGVGYMVIDLSTGSGAYLIGGGLDGSFSIFTGFFFGLVLTQILGTLFANPINLLYPAPVLVAVAFAAILIAAMAFIYSKMDDRNKGCFLTGLFLGAGLGVMPGINAGIAKGLEPSLMNADSAATLTKFLSILGFTMTAVSPAFSTNPYQDCI
jgi:hypothetical protein